jgi:hypothetical protein
LPLKKRSPRIVEKLIIQTMVIAASSRLATRAALGLLAAVVVACAAPAGAAAPKAEPAGLEFFEKHVRPLLVEHCYKCHSAQAEKLKGGLLLDTRDGVLKGGDTGPALLPGDPDKSLLIKAVRYTDPDLQMPPLKSGGKLSDEQIHHLEAWVKMGAPDPRDSALTQHATRNTQHATNHWAFKPVRRPQLPAVKSAKLIQTPVDSFVLAKLEAKGLTLSPRADKRTLIRRATYDLTGLPPTPEEVRAFEKDPAPDAFAKVVDRLLASPRYGERWGRYWLDVARYADTKGYVFEEERKYPYSYTYRDWVIRAFNEDLPYDQFLVQQLAADLLPLGEDKRPLAALGFLTLGRRFLNNPHDIIDDRIDVVSRGTMGLTVTCARCHDHKFDPITMKDYYGLYGVFASSHEPKELPLLGNASMPPQYDEYVAERKKREAELEDFVTSKEEEVRTKLRGQVGDYLLVVHDAAQADEEKREGLVRERKLQPSLARNYRGILKDWEKEKNPIFAPWFAFAALPKTNFAQNAKEVIAGLAGASEPSNVAATVRSRDAASSGSETNAGVQPSASASRDLTVAATSIANVHPHVAKLFSPDAPPESLRDVAEAYNKLFAEVDREWKTAQTNAPATKALPDPAHEALRQVLYAEGSPIVSLGGDELRRFTDTPVQQKTRALKRKVDELDATHPGAPPRAMALVDNSQPTEPHIFKRGNPGTPGDEVPRQFVEIAARQVRQPFTNGSGRLEMARAIASPDNPLTARVWVNRVWQHHFDSPLVRTPADFGVRSDPPTHPELIDWLASEFMEPVKSLNGSSVKSEPSRRGDDTFNDSTIQRFNASTPRPWSTKHLHRLILLSATWQQASDDNPKAAKADPANQLFWRQNRQRLDLEAMRDTLLAVSGQLDLTTGGRAVDILEPTSTRRTVYGFVERQNLPGLFRTFDFASPDTTSAQRFHTTVPQQALFLMNSPFATRQARRLLERPEIQSAVGDEERIQRLYGVALQRRADAEEVKLARKFIAVQEAASAPAEPAPSSTWSYGYGKFDESTRRVTGFTALPHWTGYAWQGGPELPDPQLGWVILNADGGHVGNDQNHAAIRRWRAPRDGVVSVTGELNHPSNQGDGVRARAVSSRLGPLGEWTAQHQKVSTPIGRIEVKRGDILDFVTDCRASVSFDTFHWAPVIKMISEATKPAHEAERRAPARLGPSVDRAEQELGAPSRSRGALRASNSGSSLPEATTEWSAQAGFAGPAKPAEKPVEKPGLSPWEKLAQVLLLSNELMFVD